MFESVGIGPAGGEPVEFVPVDVDDEELTSPGDKRRLGVVVAVGLAALVAVVAAGLWVSTRWTEPEPTSNWEPYVPTDPSLAFEWTGPNSDEDRIIVSGSARTPHVLTIGPNSGTVFALDESGVERWHADVGGGQYGDAYQLGDSIVVVTQNPDRGPNDEGETASVVVTALDAATGDHEWQTSVPGESWDLADDHIVVFEYPTEVETVAGVASYKYPPVAIRSVSMESGESVGPERVDELFGSDGSGDLLVERDFEVFTIDGALKPTSAAIPIDNESAGSGESNVLVVGDGTVTVYDAEGTVIRSANELPDDLGISISSFVTGAGSDLWIYSNGGYRNSCGVFRFGEDDDAPVGLWQQEYCYLSRAYGFAEAGTDTDPPRWYVYRYGSDSDDDTETLVDLTTGQAVAKGDWIFVGTNGVVVSDGDRIVGKALAPGGRDQPMFELDAPEEWSLIGGAVAIATRARPGEPRTVRIYR